MARCGRCGLWAPYPEDYKEQKYRGTCLYFQIRLREDQVYEERDCKEFFELIPGWTPFQQFDYKLKRDQLGAGFQTDRRARFLGYTAIVLSIVSLLVKALSG